MNDTVKIPPEVLNAGKNYCDSHFGSHAIKWHNAKEFSPHPAYLAYLQGWADCYASKMRTPDKNILLRVFERLKEFIKK